MDWDESISTDHQSRNIYPHGKVQKPDQLEQEIQLVTVLKEVLLKLNKVQEALQSLDPEDLLHPQFSWKEDTHIWAMEIPPMNEWCIFFLYAQCSILDTYIMKISTTWRLLSNKDITAAIITLAYDNNQKVIVTLINAFINANDLMSKSPEKQVWEQFIINLIMCLINHGIHRYFIEVINKVKSGDISFKHQDKDI